MITGIGYKTRPRYGIVWETIVVGTLQARGKERFARPHMLQLNGISAQLGPRTCLACSQKSLEGLQLVVLALPPPPAPPACLPPQGEGRTGGIRGTSWHFTVLLLKVKTWTNKTPKSPSEQRGHEEVWRGRGLSPRGSPGRLDGRSRGWEIKQKDKGSVLKGKKRLLPAGKVVSNLIFATELGGRLNLGERGTAPLSPHPSSPPVLPVLGRSSGRGLPPAVHLEYHQHGGVGSTPKLYRWLCRRTARAGRDLWRPSHPTPAQAGAAPAGCPGKSFQSTPPATGPARNSSPKAARHLLLVAQIKPTAASSYGSDNLRLCPRLVISGKDSMKEADRRKRKFCTLKKQGRSETGRVWCPVWAWGRNTNKSWTHWRRSTPITPSTHWQTHPVPYGPSRSFPGHSWAAEDGKINPVFQQQQCKKEKRKNMKEGSIW